MINLSYKLPRDFERAFVLIVFFLFFFVCLYVCLFVLSSSFTFSFVLCLLNKSLFLLFFSLCLLNAASLNIKRRKNSQLLILNNLMRPSDMQQMKRKLFKFFLRLLQKTLLNLTEDKLTQIRGNTLKKHSLIIFEYSFN